jgi:hypothetical protein
MPNSNDNKGHWLQRFDEISANVRGTRTAIKQLIEEIIAVPLSPSPEKQAGGEMSIDECLVSAGIMKYDFPAGLEERVRIAMELYRNQQKPVGDGWVRVEDGLPEIGEYVLVHNTEGAMLVGRRFSYDWVALFTDGETSMGELTATHWMPLPAPPTTDTTEEIPLFKGTRDQLNDL